MLQKIQTQTLGHADEEEAGLCTVAFFGSSILSSYWNGAATYYRGLLHALAEKGCRIRFYEPAVRDRHLRRDIDPPSWAEVSVWDAHDTGGVDQAVADASGADLVVRASGIGAHEAYLGTRVLDLQDEGSKVVYWDVDAPATLDRMDKDPSDPLHAVVPEYDAVMTYGGGEPVRSAYRRFGARDCMTVYNAVDAATHHPVAPRARFESDLSLLANRLPDREERIDEFFLRPCRTLDDHRFILGGSGWDGKDIPPNVERLGHVPQDDHNAFNCSARFILNVARKSMAAYGWSPATRVFEAAGAGACIISDAWPGIEDFLDPGKEVLLAEDGDDVVDHVRQVDADEAAAIGAAARERVLREHTYADRADQVLDWLRRKGVVGA